MRRRLPVALLVLLCPVFLAAEPEARKVLFFDLWKLDHWQNIKLCQGEPEWVAECEYSDPSFLGERVYAPSVWREESGEFRMIYSLKWSPLTLMAAKSADGISWQPLPVEGIAPEGAEKLAPHHVLTLRGGSGGAVYEDPRRTDGYRFRIFGRLDGEVVHERAKEDPNHRWHAIAKAEGPKRYMGEGVTLVSKDGLDWEIQTGGHWDWLADDWFPEPPVFAFWNERKKTHVMTARPGWGDRRQVIRESKDLRTWSEPELLFQPDSLDTEAPVAFYGLPVEPVGNGAGFVGLLWTFHNSNSRPVGSFNQFFGPMDAQLVYSYDGRRFSRGLREAFLERNPMPKPGCVQVRPSSILPVGDEFFVYSHGNRGAHGREKSQQRLKPEEQLSTLLLHRLRKDGWMYLEPKGDWATIQTKPFVLEGGGIQINADASYGEIRAQVTDVKSQPIEGFSFDDSEEIRGKDGLSLSLRWKGGEVGQLPNTPVRLELEFRQAKVYAIEMEHHFLDAQDQWLLQDGKPIPGRRFDF